MNKSKRKFLQVLPVAALTSFVVGKDIKAHELSKDKRYVFTIPSDIIPSDDDIKQFKTRLRETGFGDCLIITDNVKIYELS